MAGRLGFSLGYAICLSERTWRFAHIIGTIPLAFELMLESLAMWLVTGGNWPPAEMLEREWWGAVAGRKAEISHAMGNCNR